MNNQVRYISLLGSSIFYLLLASCKEQKEAIEPKQPNILFILADDFGYHDLSSTGSNFYETPNIDRIAKEGMTFTNGYATCQVCSPSRASIMSGKFPARHGITDWIGAPTGTDWRKVGRFNKLLPPDYEHNLPQDMITLPEAMRATSLGAGPNRVTAVSVISEGVITMIVLSRSTPGPRLTRPAPRLICQF